MVRGAWGISLLAVAAGCTLVSPPADRPVILSAAFTDRTCREVAGERADDAAVNGYDTGLQARIARDSYANCMAMKPGGTP